MATWARIWAIIAATVFFVLGILTVRDFAADIRVPVVRDIQLVIATCYFGISAAITAILFYGEAILETTAGFAASKAGSVRGDLPKSMLSDPSRTVDEVWEIADGTYVVLLQSGEAIASFDKTYRTFASMASWRELTSNRDTHLLDLNTGQTKDFFATVGAKYGLVSAK